MNVIYIPYKISFSEAFNDSHFLLDFLLEVVPVYIFLFDIAFSFNLAFYLKGDYICNRVEISKHYI